MFIILISCCGHLTVIIVLWIITITDFHILKHPVADPEKSHEFPMDYLERVKKVHSEGGYGSQG